MKVICTGLGLNLYIHSSAFTQKHRWGSRAGLCLDSPLWQLYTGKGNSCSFDAVCTFVDPISVCAVAETVEKLVVLPAPYCGRSSCDFAQILSITAAPLSD